MNESIRSLEPSPFAALWALDPTPWLVVPECLRFLGGLLPGGWPELTEANRALADVLREAIDAA